MSPTARTLTYLRRLGFTADVCERWLPRANIRKDLFGCIDILAIKPGEPVLGVQATSGNNISARLTKARALLTLKTWLASGCVFEVWGWSQRNGRWVVRRVGVRAEDLEPVDLTPRPKPRRQRKGERQGLLFGEH
jgi:hypothetical protein